MDTANQPIQYFTNDTVTLINEELEYFKEATTECMMCSFWPKKKCLTAMIQFLQRNKLEEDDETARNIIRSVDPFKNFECEDENDKFENVLFLFLRDEGGSRALTQAYEDFLYQSSEFIQDKIESEKDWANTCLDQDGFLGDRRKYIIFGSNMGWRHRSGYRITEVSNVDDLGKAVTGNYDYIIRISRDHAKCPYLRAVVSTHDAPLGESYVMIPADVLDEALKDESIREKYEMYGKRLKIDMEE